MATYKEGNEQFPAHVWKKDVDEYGGPVERSSTPVGDFIISGKGYGRMRWSVTYPDGNEALGTTRREVRAEADSGLRDLIEESKRPKPERQPPSEDSV